MKTIVLTALGMVALAAPANAAVTYSVASGSASYTGAAPTYNFDSTVPSFSGGKIASGTSQTVAAPLGSTGNYYAVGPNDGPGVINLGSLGAISSLSFLWGSVDTGNTLSFLDAAGTAFYTLTGSQLLGAGATGNQTTPASNPVVTFNFSGASQAISGLRLTALPGASNPSGFSFEIDNLAISAVPETATWAMMLLGVGLVGGVMRRKQKVSTRVNFA